MTIQTNILDTVLVKPISLYLSENIYLSLWTTITNDQDQSDGIMSSS